MGKIAIIIMADTGDHAQMARVANALTAAKEFKEGGDTVKVIFDGAATQWLPVLEDDDHPLHELYTAIKDNVEGACSFCADTFNVKEEIEACRVKCLSEFEGHPSFKTLVDDDFRVLTF